MFNDIAQKSEGCQGLATKYEVLAHLKSDLANQKIHQVMFVPRILIFSGKSHKALPEQTKFGEVAISSKGL